MAPTETSDKRAPPVEPALKKRPLLGFAIKTEQLRSGQPRCELPSRENNKILCQSYLSLIAVKAQQLLCTYFQGSS